MKGGTQNEVNMQHQRKFRLLHSAFYIPTDL